ncbi:endonuclease/exonuclease/phosphatase family protein [Mesorhizobium metallidurans]|nr:endonuclease/exonuclease/phosphatase family protein [Mesorhizobium metallidurans]
MSFKSLSVAFAMLFALGAGASFFGGRQFWTADLINFFRPHLLVLGLLLAVLCLSFRSRIAVLAAALCALTAVVPMLVLPQSARPAPGFPLRIMSANLLIDIQNPDTSRLEAYIAQQRPDLIVTEETLPVWQNALLKSTGLPFDSNRDLNLRDDMKLLSRFPILSEKVVADKIRYPDLVRHPVRFEIATPAGTVIVYAVHPDTPRRPWQWRQRNAYLALLAEVIRKEPPQANIVVVGDWNAPNWSPFFRDFFSATGLLSTESGRWPSPTRFSTRYGSFVPLGTPIDHFAVSAGIGLTTYATGPKFGSNHVPIFAELTLPIR